MSQPVGSKDGLEMIIYVSFLNEKLKLDVSKHDTIKVVTEKIKKLRDDVKSEFDLQWHSKVLDNSKTLLDYKIANHTVIYLIVEYIVQILYCFCVGYYFVASYTDCVTFITKCLCLLLTLDFILHKQMYNRQNRLK